MHLKCTLMVSHDIEFSTFHQFPFRGEQGFSIIVKFLKGPSTGKKIEMGFAPRKKNQTLFGWALEGKKIKKLKKAFLREEM